MPGGNGIHVDVGQHVCTNHHGRVVVVECLYNLGKGVFVRVYIVAVELHAEFACLGVVCANIPATADAEVVAFGYEVYHACVFGEFFDCFRCAVGAMVVDYYQVEWEVGLLAEYAAELHRGLCVRGCGQV